MLVSPTILLRIVAIIVTALSIAGIAQAADLSLSLDRTTLFAGSYQSVAVKIDPTSGLSLDDIEFIIPSEAAGGEISLSRDDTFSPDEPTVMLLVGHSPGAHQLRAVHRNTNQVLDQIRFKIITVWPDEINGPSLWINGDYELKGVAGAAWGGGIPDEPENYNIIPATGKRQVAVLLLDTSTQRFTTTESHDFVDDWEDILSDGFNHNGRTHSIAAYYSEVSYNKFTFEGDVFGPVQLSGPWSDYLEDNGNYKSNLWQACASAGDALIDYSKYQHLICAIRSVDVTPTQPARRVWAHADSFVAHVGEGQIALSTVSIPAEGNLFDLLATAVHELGHNLLLGDIYKWNGHPSQIQDRELGGWALMAHQSGLPHPVLVHRMRLGWVPKDDLKLYNFRTIAGSVDETVTLQAVEIDNPPSNQDSGVEVRIAPGWNYYFEYRAAQPPQIGDQNLPTDRAVLGTDTSFVDDLESLQRRKPVMLLREDVDGDGPVLVVGDDYRERDTTEPQMVTDFRASVTRVSGQTADLHIQYGVHSQPDPSIRPWNPPVYQSVDVEVRNQRNKTDKKWLNVPWAGHQNDLIAKVTNRGDMNAPDVIIDFYVKDMSVNAKSKHPQYIGTDKKSVNAKQTEEFKTIWMPGKGGHYCIEVRIHHYQTPGPNSVIEATELNNFAQSNYDRFISATASAPSRELALVKVENPFDVTVRTRLKVIKSTSPLYRTYLEHRWLTLQPGESRNVMVMFEYAFLKPPVWNPTLEAYIGKPNDIAIAGFIKLPRDALEAAMIPLGGINAQVVTGRATRTNLNFDPPRVLFGQVLTHDDSSAVSSGQVILITDPGRRERTQILSLDTSGRFSANLDFRWRTAIAYYLPAVGYADSESPEIANRLP